MCSEYRQSKRHSNTLFFISLYESEVRTLSVVNTEMERLQVGIEDLGYQEVDTGKSFPHLIGSSPCDKNLILRSGINL